MSTLLQELESRIEEIARRVAREVLEAQSAGAAVPADRLLSVKHASQLTDIPEDTIRKRIQRGQVPAFRSGRSLRVRLSDLVKEGRAS